MATLRLPRMLWPQVELEAARAWRKVEAPTRVAGR
jgi:hypothetical protein